MEAAGCGTATIGLAQGGSLETIIPNVTGKLLEKVDQQSLTAALDSWNEKKYQPQDLFAHSAKFSKEIFKQKLLAFVESKLS